MHILLYPKVLVSGGNILIYKQFLGVWPFFDVQITQLLFFVADVLAAHYLALPEKLCLI